MKSIKALMYQHIKSARIRRDTMYSGSIPPASTRLTIQGLSTMLMALVLSEFST